MNAIAINQYIRTAQSIGYKLCRDAIWEKDQCNWMTMTHQVDKGKMIPCYKTMGTDFYAGTIGVGFFLAALYNETKEQVFQKTAEGAFKQALNNFEKVEPAFRFSFFRGHVGIIYSLLYYHKRCNGDKIWKELAKKILEILYKEDITLSMNDVIDGKASGIPALIDIYEWMPSEKLKKLIFDLGDQLILDADKTAEGWSWKGRVNASDGNKQQANLLGFSHGSAGKANAFCKLYQFCKEKKYLDAFELAIKYENFYYDAREKNWPDLRGGESGKFTNAWCHGAPGIGLSRIRAYSVLKSDYLLTDAMNAYSTTEASLNLIFNADESQAIGFGLCHGVGGNTDLLIECSQILEKDSMMNKAQELGEFGIERYESSNLAWVNGVGNDYQIPDFMLGISGIGYFYLRLFDPRKFKSFLVL